MARWGVIKPKVPSQADVARHAGVSRATVSQVLNNTTGFSFPAETRQRVVDAARQLGYVPNASARSLRTQKTSTIGVVIQDINNPFYPAFVRGVQDIAEADGYDVISYNTDSTERRERHFLDVLRRGRVDGLVGIFWHVDEHSFEDLTGRGIPIALLGPLAQPHIELIDQVYVDERRAARQAVEHLLGRGHQYVTLVAGPEPLLSRRIQGYLDAMADADLQANVDIVRAADFTEAGGHQVGRELFQRPHRPTALFAVSDVVALGLLHASRDIGLRVPDDLALVGFDDIPVARLLTPALTTVHQFQHLLGQRCAQLLLDRLTGRHSDPHGRCVEMPFELIVRAST